MATIFDFIALFCECSRTT